MDEIYKHIDIPSSDILQREAGEYIGDKVMMKL